MTEEGEKEEVEEEAKVNRNVESNTHMQSKANAGENMCEKEIDR